MTHCAVSPLCSCTLGLALCSLPLFLTSCGEDNPADGKNPPGESPGKAAQNSPSAPFVVIPDLLAAPSPAVEAGPTETSPGLRQQKFIAPLRDAYERMDPTRDGWSSEAFSAAAKEQLSLLEKLLGNPRELQVAPLKELAVREVSTTSLRPANLPVAFSDDRFVVRRSNTANDSRATGVDALATNLNILRSGKGTIEPHMKIFRVFPAEENTAGCLVLVDILKTDGTSRTQINATWSCKWRLAPGQPPLLSSIVLTSYEEII